MNPNVNVKGFPSNIYFYINNVKDQENAKSDIECQK